MKKRSILFSPWLLQSPGEQLSQPNDGAVSGSDAQPAGAALLHMGRYLYSGPL